MHLYYDDATFRGSRFYFRSIGCSNSFEQSIRDTEVQLTSFRTQAIEHDFESEDDYMPNLEVENGEGIENGESAESTESDYNKTRIEEFDRVCLRLKDVRLQIGQKRDELKALRDGVSICKRLEFLQTPLHRLLMIAE